MTSDGLLIYDTTLRDGTQGENVNFSAEEKLRIAKKFDEIGVHYIEGGWPASNPRDMRFFQNAKEYPFRNARLTAFASTGKAGRHPRDCENIIALLEAETPAVEIFGKSWDLHVREVLGLSLDENKNIIGHSVEYLKSQGKEVLFAAEHFFDGYKNNSDYAMKTVEAALSAGADFIVLCDTNGGTLPWEISDIIDRITPVIDGRQLGIHCHNDCGMAVANSLSAVQCGVRMVQGTINGYGERCGNADLISIIANLQLKMNMACLPPDSVTSLTALSRYVSDVANIPPLKSRPFVGKSAFAHKGGVHVNAIQKNPRAYEHIEPEAVGNERRVIVSDLSGRSTIRYKADEMGVTLDDDDHSVADIVDTVKKMEDEGYQFDVAGGTLELLIRESAGEVGDFFTLDSFQVTDQKNGDEASSSYAMIKISVGRDYEITAAEGNGPVNALDNALRKALSRFYPYVEEMHLVDFKVGIVEGREGTAAKVRVLLESRDETDIWATMGVSTNIIEASWYALVDSVRYKLMKDERSHHTNRSQNRTA